MKGMARKTTSAGSTWASRPKTLCATSASSQVTRERAARRRAAFTSTRLASRSTTSATTSSSTSPRAGGARGWTDSSRSITACRSSFLAHRSGLIVPGSSFRAHHSWLIGPGSGAAEGADHTLLRGGRLGVAGTAGLLVEGLPQHLAQFVEDRQVGADGGPDGPLHLVVAGDVERVLRLHRGPDLAGRVGLARQAFPPARLEPAEAGLVARTGAGGQLAEAQRVVEPLALQVGEPVADEIGIVGLGRGEAELAGHAAQPLVLEQPGEAAQLLLERRLVAA